MPNWLKQGAMEDSAIEAAKDAYSSQDLEFDDKPKVKWMTDEESNNPEATPLGAWVAAWVWVAYSDVDA